MVPFPLLISLNSRMPLEAGGEQGRGAPFPSLALSAPAAPPAGPPGPSAPRRCGADRLAAVLGGQEGCHPHGCASLLLLGVQEQLGRTGWRYLALSVAIAGCL